MAEGENVSRVALRLNVSQPPLSRQIKQLEEEPGCALFERTAKALRLAGAGKVFMKEARDILRRMERAAEAASEPVRIGYAPSLASTLLPGILRRLGAQSSRGERVGGGRGRPGGSRLAARASPNSAGGVWR